MQFFCQNQNSVSEIQCIYTFMYSCIVRGISEITNIVVIVERGFKIGVKYAL